MDHGITPPTARSLANINGGLPAATLDPQDRPSPESPLEDEPPPGIDNTSSTVPVSAVCRGKTALGEESDLKMRPMFSLEVVSDGDSEEDSENDEDGHDKLAGLSNNTIKSKVMPNRLPPIITKPAPMGSTNDPRKALPGVPSLSSLSSSSPSSSSPPGGAILNGTDESILRFPVESLHSYSYAYISQSGLSYRLGVLKRALAFLNDSTSSSDPFPSKGDKALHTSSNSTTSLHKYFKHNSSLTSEFNDSTSCSTKLGSALNNTPRTGNRSTSIGGASTNNVPPYTYMESNQPHFAVKSSASSTALSILSSMTSDKLDKLENRQDIYQIFAIIDPPAANHSIMPHSPSSPRNNDNNNLSTPTSPDSGSCPRTRTKTSNVRLISKLQSNLLEALAKPYHDPSFASILYRNSSFVSLPNTNGPNSFLHSSASLLNFTNHPSPVSPSLATSSAPGNPGANNSPFAMASKYSTSQVIFTTSAEAPFVILAANDLACLIIGMSQKQIKHLPILDVIEPSYHEELLARIKCGINNDRTEGDSSVLICGAVIPIKKGNGTESMASFWVKHKGDLLVWILEEIVFDRAEIGLDLTKEQPYFTNLKGSLNIFFPGGIDPSHNLWSLLPNLPRVKETGELDITKINQTRYFTIKTRTNHEENTPTDIQFNPLTSTLKLTSLPHMAGLIIIKGSDLSIVKYNKAFVKNLFGYTYGLHEERSLIGKSIETLVPRFAAYLKLIIDSELNTNNDHGASPKPNQQPDFRPGLVIPEHLFRKIASRVDHCTTTPELKPTHNAMNYEQLSGFYQSKGISALHRDGKTLKIDVQLRILVSGYYGLWITFSRHIQGVHEVSEFPSQLSLLRRERSEMKAKTVNVTTHATIQDEEVEVGDRTIDSIDTTPPDITLSDGGGSNLESHLSSLSLDDDDDKSLKSTISSATSLPEGGAVNTGNKSPNHNEVLSPSIVIPAAAMMIESESMSNPSSCSPSAYSLTRLMSSTPINAGPSTLTRASYPQVTKIGAHKRTKKLSDFDVVSDMGEGAYGKVILARYREQPCNLVVIKSVYKNRILVDTWVRDMNLGTIPSEIKIMVALSEKPHANITEIIDFFEDKECYHIEMIPHGNPAIDLFDLIELQPNMPEEDCKSIFQQVTSAIKHLHDLGIAHRDIKDENIILDKQGQLKLIDFGSATYVRSGPFDVFVGTLDYASPEVLSGQPYEGKPQDIWALGILLYTIIYKENPFYNVDEIMEGELRVPFVMSEESISLIRMILNRNVNQRPTIDHILAHPWLAKPAV